MKCFGLLSALSFLVSFLCGCGTVAQVAAPIALAVATKNASAMVSGAGAAFANKAMTASVDANGASFNNNNVSAQANMPTASGQRTATGAQTISASQNTMTIEFMANDSTGWRTLQNYRRQNWNIINYEILSYGAIRMTLFRRQR